MNKNIVIGYVLGFVRELYFPIAIWLLFFLNYLDFTQVAIIGALTTISSNLFEIPTGAISDLIGRKWTLFWAFILSSVGLGVIASGSTFWVFALGRIINGLGQSLYSGTHESLLYDTVQSNPNAPSFDHIVSKVETLAWIGLFVSAVTGGIIYDLWPQGPFVLSAIIYVGVAVMCLFLDEPAIDSETFSLKTYVKQNLQGFGELFKDSKTTSISLLMITIMAGYFFASKILGISQAEEYGLNGSGIGLLFGFGYIMAAAASYLYPRLREKFGNTKLLLAATAALLASFVFAPFVGVAVGSGLIMMRISSSTTFNNAKSVIMNNFINSKNRATALSTLALLSQIPFTLTFYFVGRYLDLYSPNSFALFLGVLLIGLLIPQSLWYLSINRHAKT